MLNNFVKKIVEIYDIVLQPIDIIYKLTAINNYKLQLNIGKDESFGEYYINLLQNKKENGVIYTPKEMADFIVQNTIRSEDLIQNPFIKIADPSCGSGNLIIACFKHLKRLYEENIDIINRVHNINLNQKDVNKHILENNLFGYDIDEVALKILMIDLFCLAEKINIDNFKNKDFLFERDDIKFDVFLGNPPYIGQKMIDKDYSKLIKEKYRQIFKDKGDLSYCFFKAALNKLPRGGKLTFITSRYFLEAVSGEELRKTLKEFCSIDKIVDFYGIRPFKNIGIDIVIIFLSLGGGKDNIAVFKPKLKYEKSFYDSLFNHNGNSYSAFYINKNLLSDKGWVLRDETERAIVSKIEQKCFTSLGNICLSYQGIITGCDKAFVVDRNTIETEELEKDIIRPWIKSSYIEKEKVNRGELYLIYSNFAEDETSFPNSIKHISEYKERLIERRECKSGIRKWYELQWGREYGIFEGEKIVFPYKSNKNRFSIDKGSFFSADVYCLLLKEETPFTYEYLIKILNSKVYEFYFKTFAKKLGEDLYEYYPNNLMKLCIPNFMDIKDCTDNFLYNFFELNRNEIEIIEKYII